VDKKEGEERERERENIRQQLNLENVGTDTMGTGTMGTKNLIVIPIYNFSCQSALILGRVHCYY